MAIREGDIVSVKLDATYYDGKPMPSWVKSELWIVKSVAGDRAVIDKNVNGGKSICSPVHIAQLNVESRSLEPSPNPETPKPMQISERGVELVAKYEGCKLKAYLCPANVWTIGYGHTEGVRPGDTLPSQQAAKDLLRKDLARYAGYVNRLVENGKIAFALNQNQFDALTSFVYNCGNGSLQKLVTGRDAATVAEKLLLYNKGGGRVLAGLDRRRKEERQLFLS